MKLNYLMVKLQSWISREYAVPVQWHWPKVLSDPEWWHLIEFYIWVKFISMQTNVLREIELLKTELFDHLTVCKQMADV